MKEREFLRVIVPLSTFGLLSIAIFGAFSRGVKRQIHERDGWQCVRCGATNPLEACHIDHNRRNPRYNHSSNGRTLCPEHHLEDHINREGKNGLSREANDWAIEMIAKRT